MTSFDRAEHTCVCQMLGKYPRRRIRGKGWWLDRPTLPNGQRTSVVN